MSPEFHAGSELVATLLSSPRTGVLVLLLIAAALIDIRSGRIPNWLVFGGAAYALAFNAFFPPYPRDIGILFALGGLAVGLGALLPLYAFGAMGAGDVKLMAMVGAFLGASATLGCVLATLVAGGVMALGLSLWSGHFLRMLRNVSMMCRGTMLTLATGVGGLAAPHEASAGRMAYGVAIAAGTIGYLVLAQLGFLGKAVS